MTSGLDPFATAGLRAAIAESWRLSQTRLLEDCAAESDLVSVGYRDRLFTELAANGADAAAAAGVPGTVAVWVTGRELHVANTGAPLSAAGVRSLTALRVSAKAGHRPGARDIGARDIGAAATDAADIGPVEAGVGGDDETPPAVGRFGVGFTATATIADTVEIRSRSGSVLFDRARTWAEIETIGVAGALTARQVPLLRLVWESSRGPADGFDTEIVLTVRAGIDLDGLLVGMSAEAPDLLLELTALSEIDIAGTRFVIHRRPHPEVPDVGTAIVRGGGAGERAWLVAHGRSASWLVETDATGPLGVYGQTKLEGERGIAASGCRHLIFRTSWVYAARGGNFAKTMLKLAKDRERLTVINDQFGAPTGADLIADVTAHAIRQVWLQTKTVNEAAHEPDGAASLSGVYHLVASGVTTWFDYANHVLGLDAQGGFAPGLAVKEVAPVPSTAFVTTAKRPYNSRLSTAKLQQAFGLTLPAWQQGVNRMLAEIA